MRLLVAEDHHSFGQSLGEGLREGGYAVDFVMNGIEAAHLAMTEPYDCVLLDINLPGKDGFDILKDLRSGGRDTPVLCLTARDALEDRVQGLNLGGDDYLV